MHDDAGPLRQRAAALLSGALLCAALLTGCAGGSAAPGEGAAEPSRSQDGRESQTLRLEGADGMELRCVLAGQGPLLIVPTPGWGPSLELYERTLRPLEQDFTMAYLDTRGTGESTRPELPILWQVERFAADLDRVRKGVGRKTNYVLGHGSGSAIALAYAIAYPEQCSGLVLVAATASRDDAWRHRMMQRVQERLRHDPAFEERLRQLAALSAAGLPEDDAEARARLLATLPTMFAEPAVFAAHRAPFEAMVFRADARQNWEAAAGKLDFTALLDLVRCPVLVINGEADHMAAPADARILVDGLPAAELEIAENAAHFPWLEQPDAFFARVRAWLDRRG